MVSRGIAESVEYRFFDSRGSKAGSLDERVAELLKEERRGLLPPNLLEARSSNVLVVGEVRAGSVEMELPEDRVSRVE